MNLIKKSKKQNETLVSLFNHNTSIDKNIIEQYKIIVETTQKVTIWRNDANKFFIMINGVIISFLNYSKSVSENITLLLLLMMLFINQFWIKYIKSLKLLNKIKFDIISEIEKKMPLNLFEYEWNLLSKSKYIEISQSDLRISYIFFISIFIIL